VAHLSLDWSIIAHLRHGKRWRLNCPTEAWKKILETCLGPVTFEVHTNKGDVYYKPDVISVADKANLSGRCQG
jgi:hypothetical protein